MAHLIIGHTTETTARIWVRGDKPGICSLVVDPAVGSIPQKALGEETDFTGVFHLEGLTPGDGLQRRGEFFYRSRTKSVGQVSNIPEAAGPTAIVVQLRSLQLQPLGGQHQ